ncbi:hypothetical protein WJX73_001863 [Symbiochloris irregularis]|uniref:RRP15-like protein n=1 Tax=Symbiochloris irregularis TaxID=706552 RepID=A0AAW1PP17_9CHLO
MAADVPTVTRPQGRKRQKLISGQQAEVERLPENRRSESPVSSTLDSQSAGRSSDTESQDTGSDQTGDLQEAPMPNVGKPGASFARAFAKILSQPQAASLKGTQAKTAHSTGLSEQSAHHLRQNLRRRDHVVVRKLGEDAVHDATEKALMKTATRGVVQLFNAVSAAQHIKSAGRKPQTAQAREAAHAKSEVKGTTQQQPGWDILRAGYDPFREQGGTKLKDWNQAQPGTDSEAGPQGGSSSDESQ